MGGSSSKQEQQVVSRAPTIGGSELQGILSNLGGISPNVTGAETGALNQLQTNANAGNQFAPAITSNANSMLSGGPQALQDTVAGKFLDPNTNPFFSQLTELVSNRARDLSNAQYAGSGRDPAGAGTYGQTLGRGVAEGLAPIFASQYNQERGNQMQGFNQDLAQRQSGTNMANAATMANNYGPLQTLQIEAQRRGIPLEVLAAQAGIALPAANAFATQTGNTSGTQQMSGAQQFATVAQGLGSLWPKAPTSFSFG